MPEQPAAEKTEQPTPKKLQKAKEEGQVPQSQELASVLILVALLLSLGLLAPGFLHWFIIKTQNSLSGQTSIFSDSSVFMDYVGEKIVDVMFLLSPIFATLCAVSVTACIAIGGLNLSPQAIQFNWNTINPASGLQKLISARSMVHFAASIAKLLFVSIVVWVYLHSRLDTFATLRWAWSAQIIAAIAKIIFGLCIRAAIALLAIGLADAFYQKWKYTQDLKMTRQEVKQERKDLEGSPEVKSRIRRIQVQLSMQRLMQEVPKASVILVNPTHVAVALRYEAKAMDAPVLLAKGSEYLAERIVKIGRAYGVPVVRRPVLARTIYSTVQPGNPIPQELYVAVAEVLAMIYRLRKKKMRT